MPELGQTGTFYARASSASPGSREKALFQSAYADRLQKNYSNKIATLEKHISHIPILTISRSFYEIGRSYIMLINDKNAVKAFQRLLNRSAQQYTCTKIRT
jgi:hypothetical protein